MEANARGIENSLGRLAAINIAVALAVVGIKFTAYVISGSVAIFSDALESIVNVLTAGAALFAIRVSTKPADREHPFGHHKAEFLAAIFEGAMIAVAAVLILMKASDALTYGSKIESPGPALAITALAAICNGLWAAHLIKRGREARSEALVADGQHLYTDVVTSVGVIIGLLLAVMTGWYWLDPLMAALVAINILWVGYRIIMRSMSALLDRAASPEIETRIRRIIEANGDGALQAHDIRTRQAGRKLFLEFHLVVPGGMTVEAAHHICDRLEDAIEREIEDSEAVIHLEPDYKAKPVEAKGTVEI